MNDFLGEVKTKPELFLKLVRKISKPEYTMHMMEDRNGRKAMFYNYKGVEFQEGDCVKLKATIADHRINKYDSGAPLTYLNRVTIYPHRAEVMLPYEYCFVTRVTLSVKDIKSIGSLWVVITSNINSQFHRFSLTSNSSILMISINE